MRSFDNKQYYRGASYLNKNQQNFNTNCLSVIRREKSVYKLIIMDCAQLKLQQQKKCINELSNYIDQLEGRIEQLQSNNQQLKKQLQAGRDLSSFVDDKFKNNNELVRMMNEQMLVVEKEKKRWREELKVKNRELQSQKELVQIQMKNLRNVYQEKLSHLEDDWNTKQNQLRQEIKVLKIQNERIKEQNMVYKNQLKNIDQCQQMLKIRKQMIELQSNTLKQSLISEDQNKTCKCFDQYESFQTENSNLKNQNQILEFQLRHLKRQIQKDAEIINDLRQKIRDLEKKISRDQNMYSINQKSSELHSKVLVQLQSLKKERQISVDLLQTTESVRSYNFYRTKQFQKLKRKEGQELSKMNSIFERIDFDLRR